MVVVSSWAGHTNQTISRPTLTDSLADPFNEIAESNENNNTATVGFSVS
jgi:hypothetical protein